MRTLKRIETLVTDLHQQGKNYGLEGREAVGSDPKKAIAMVAQMRRSLHRVLMNSKPKKTIAASIQAEKSQEAPNGQKEKETNFVRRLCWAIRDKEKFEHFVGMLEKHVNGLQKLIFESQQKWIQQEGTRLDMQLLQDVSDPERLSLLQNASPYEESFSEVDVAYLAQCKAITLQRAQSLPRSNSNINSWNIHDITPEYLSKTRFIKPASSNPEIAYLFEKKDYDPNISEDNKDLLQERIRKLVSLLEKPTSSRHLQTLQAIGYIDDPDRHCWWIVFRFPLSPFDTPETMTSEPLCLQKLLSSSFKPALEARYKLAKRIAYTFAKLYSSDWMHKSINSSNIIFPQVYSTKALESFRRIETALVQGFGYSRQHTEAQTIDRGKVLHDLEAAIYRHPLYQGEAATGYQIHYDIYSLGLVLFEIAVWSPLIALLAAKYKLGKEPPVALSPHMRHFHELEAKELHRRANLRIEEELAYRVGSKYKNVVQWCLNLDGPVTAIDFYDTVVIPLNELDSQG